MLRTKKRVDYLKLKHFSLPLTSIFYMQAILLHTTHHLTIEQSNIPIKMFNLLACQIKKKKNSKFIPAQCGKKIFKM